MEAARLAVMRVLTVLFIVVDFRGMIGSKVV
jgi:hypothetical protein